MSPFLGSSSNKLNGDAGGKPQWRVVLAASATLADTPQICFVAAANIIQSAVNGPSRKAGYANHTTHSATTDEQKARLNAANDPSGKSRSMANCGAVSSATNWPGEQIEKALQPNTQGRSPGSAGVAVDV
jgi:hypothetical protein